MNGDEMNDQTGTPMPMMTGLPERVNTTPIPRQPRGVQSAFVEWERTWRDGRDVERRLLLHAIHNGSQYEVSGDGRRIVTDNVELIIASYKIEDQAIVDGLYALRARALANRRNRNDDV